MRTATYPPDLLSMSAHATGAGVQQPDVPSGWPGVLHLPSHQPYRGAHCTFRLCTSMHTAALRRSWAVRILLQESALACLATCCCCALSTGWVTKQLLAPRLDRAARPRPNHKRICQNLHRWPRTHCTRLFMSSSCCQRARCSPRPGSRSPALLPMTLLSSCASSRCSCRCVDDPWMNFNIDQWLICIGV